MHGTVTAPETDSSIVAGAAPSKLRETLGFRPAPEALLLRFQEPEADFLDERDAVHTTVDGTQTTFRQCSIGGIRAGLVEPRGPEVGARHSEAGARHSEGGTRHSETDPQRSDPDPVYEAVTPLSSSHFGFLEGDSIALSPPDDLWSPDGPELDGEALNAFDGVAFDLDGTLVELDVEWMEVGREIEDVIGFALEGPVTDYRMDELVNVSHDVEKYPQIESLFRRYEVEGARTARSLELIDLVDSLECPVGICTSNSEEAAESVLDRFDISDRVEAIVGRESVDAYKPCAEPVARCLESMDVYPGDAVFVGDRETDARAASHSGANFLSDSQIRL